MNRDTAFPAKAMPARIRVISGIGAGTDFKIRTPFFEIGSNENCACRLPSDEIPPVALAIQYDAGAAQYLIQSETSLAVTCKRKPILRDEMTPWPPGADLAIGKLVTLRLEVDRDDPSPGTASKALRPPSKPIPRPSREESASPPSPALPPSLSNRSLPRPKSMPEKSEEKNAAATKTLIQLAVTLACILGAFLIVMYGATNRDASLSGPSIPYEQIRQELQEAGRQDKEFETYASLLIQAHREYGKSKQKGRQQYNALKNRVLQSRRLTRDNDERLQRLLSHINEQLAGQ